jgi:hypothetical protein
MTPLDTFVPSLAVTILATYGQTATLRVPTSTYTAATSTAATSYTNHSVKITPPFPFNNTWTPAVQVPRGTILCYLANANLTFTPKEGQVLLTRDNKRWTVKDANPIYCGELIALWELRVVR